MVSIGLGNQSIRPIKVDGRVLSPADAAVRVLDAIERGGLAVVPFDVSYAFLAGSIASLNKIYELKLRPSSKPCPLLASWDHFLALADAGPLETRRIMRIVRAGLPVGVLTPPRWTSDIARSIPQDCVGSLVQDGRLAVFLNMGGLSEELLAEAEKRGVRLFGSSANISGQGNSFSLEEVPEHILESTDIVCEAGICKYANPERLASSIVDLVSGTLVRRGILHAEIEHLLAATDDVIGPAE